MILSNFYKTFSNDSFSHIGFNPSEKNTFYSTAQRYYNDCIDPLMLFTSITIEETGNKLAENIINGTFDVVTGGKFKTIISVYKTLLSTERLRESTPGISFKPVEMVSNAGDYIVYKIIQNNTASIINQALKHIKSGNINDKESWDVYLAAIDMYSRISLLMMDTLDESWYPGGYTAKEKEIMNNFSENKAKLCEWVYFAEHCTVPLFLTDGVKSNSANVFKNIFSKDNYVKNEYTYLWHLNPTVEAEDIIVSDDSYDKYPLFKTEKTERPSDEYSIIQRNGQYALIDYDGQLYNDKFYEYYGMGDLGEIILGSSTPENIDSGNDIIVSYDKSGECKIDEVYVGGRGSAGWDSFYYDSSNKTVNVEGPGGSYEAFSNEVVIPYWGKSVNKAVLISDKREKEQNFLYGCYYNGNFTITPSFKKGSMSFCNDMLAFYNGKKWGYFNGQTGEQVIDFICDTSYAYTENLVVIYDNKRCAYFDTTGNEVIPFGTFEEVRPVHNGLAWVKSDGKWGIIQLLYNSTAVEDEVLIKNDSTSNDLKEYAEAYYDFLRNEIELASSTSKFLLGYIDEDNIPELFVSSGNFHVAKVSLYSYYNGSISFIGEYGEYGDMFYSEKNNLFYGHWQNMGYSSFYVFKIENGSEFMIVSFHDNAAAVLDPLEIKYTIDDKEVNKKEYDEKIKQYTDGYQCLRVGYSNGFDINSDNLENLKEKPLLFVNTEDNKLPNSDDT